MMSDQKQRKDTGESVILISVLLQSRYIRCRSLSKVSIE